MFGWLASH